MSVFQELKSWFLPSNENLLKTPYGTFNLAKKGDRETMKRMVVELQRTTDALTRKDIADWRNAWQMAINADTPNRTRLYDIYQDVAIDLHLSGCIAQRTGYVMARSFKLERADGEADDEAMTLFDSPWFKMFCRLALDSIYWGHSLIELGDVYTDEAGVRRYDGVKLIPRKHVIPEAGVVVPQVGMEAKEGVSYRSEPYGEWLIEVGSADSLGLFLKAATQTIPKKNALGFWDTFAEIFGMPMRIAKTTTRDAKEKAQMEQMMQNMGAALWGVFQEGTEIEVVESTKGDAFNVYDRRIDRANSELSKLIIGQTMTIEDGSSLSQSETHLSVFNNLIEQDCDMLRDIINTQLLPRMLRHGFPVEGLTFNWDYSTDYTPEQQVNYEKMVLSNYEVDGQYFAEKYNMPVGERRTFAPLEPTDDKDDDSTETSKKQQNARPFFD